jgi:hypothetical protein
VARFRDNRAITDLKKTYTAWQDDRAEEGRCEISRLASNLIGNAFDDVSNMVGPFHSQFPRDFFRCQPCAQFRFDNLDELLANQRRTLLGMFGAASPVGTDRQQGRLAVQFKLPYIAAILARRSRGASATFRRHCGGAFSTSPPSS